MNQTLQDLKTRRSCRRYRPEQIKESELEQILEAGVFLFLSASTISTVGAP